MTDTQVRIHVPGNHLMIGVLGQRDEHLRLVEENFIYLEDISPASRSRAFDWLAARDLAPSGYDPLAPIETRREALERADAEKGAHAKEGGEQ